MKKNHGSFSFLFLLQLFASTLFAQEYIWSASIDKKEAMIHEAIYLHYRCEFADRGELYTIEFNPVGENELYDLRLLREEISFKEGKRIDTFEFVAFAKKAQKIDFVFDMEMKKTTQDSIDNTIIGRDNAQFVDYSSRHMRQEKLSVDVYETNNSLAGEFTLSYDVSATEVRAYEPVHLSIELKGRGNFQNLKPFVLALDGVKVFASPPKEQISLQQDGYHGVYSQKFAFVSDHNFTIPALELDFYDLVQNKQKTLQTEPFVINVQGGYSPKQLLDVQQQKTETWEYKEEYLWYLLCILFGFVLGKIPLQRKELREFKQSSFLQKVKDADSAKSLSFVLALRDPKKYADLIEKLQGAKKSELKRHKEEVYKREQNSIKR